MTNLQWRAYQIDDTTNLFYDYGVTTSGAVITPAPDSVVWTQRNAKAKLGNKDDITQNTIQRG